MLRHTQKAYLLVGGVEPWLDDPEAAKALAKAEFVVAVTPFANDALKKVAHVVLPIGTFAETSGTYVNLEGLWQSQTGAAQPVGESRPAWKVLRVLGNLMDLAGFDYLSSEDVREELRKLCGETVLASYKGGHRVTQLRAAGGAAVIDVPMYQTDALVRRAPSLQKTREGRSAAATY